MLNTYDDFTLNSMFRPKAFVKLFHFHRIFNKGGEEGGSCEPPLDSPLV